MAKAYWITVYHEVRDPEKLAAYGALAGPAIAADGGRFLVRDMPEQVYEQGVKARVVVIEFPDIEAARATHDSPAYQQALAALGDGVLRDIRLVPGL